MPKPTVTYQGEEIAIKTFNGAGRRTENELAVLDERVKKWVVERHNSPNLPQSIRSLANESGLGRRTIEAILADVQDEPTPKNGAVTTDNSDVVVGRMRVVRCSTPEQAEAVALHIAKSLDEQSSLAVEIADPWAIELEPQGLRLSHQEYSCERYNMPHFDLDDLLALKKVVDRVVKISGVKEVTP